VGYAKATLGDAAKDAKIGFLDLTPSQPVTVDVLRDQGFMKGFGIDTKSTSATSSATRLIRASSATTYTNGNPKKAAAPPWRTFSRSGSGHQRRSTRSTSRPLPAPTKR
jgi:hypothetical protein